MSSWIAPRSSIRLPASRTSPARWWRSTTPSTPDRWTAGALAARVAASVEGDSARELTAAGSLEQAGPAHLAFCAGGRYARALADTRAGAVVVAPGLAVPASAVALRHSAPRYAFAVLAQLLHPPPRPAPGIHPRAWVAPSATVEGATIDALAVVEEGAHVAPGAWVQSHAYVGRGAVVGPRTRLLPTAVLMDGCRLGADVILGPGAVVGADGFGHAPGPEGPVRLPHLGTAVLEDGVEMGANACVDRAVFGETRVGRSARLDNLVQIAHGAKVGASSLLAAFAGVAGRAVLGRGVVLGGRASVVEGVEVGDGATLAGLAAATKAVAPGAEIGGSPARPHRNWLRQVASLARLPDLLVRVARLEQHLPTEETVDASRPRPRRD